MNKPLLKDPSFWIVAVTLVAAADLIQLNFGVPWLQQRAAAVRPAPRMTNIVMQAQSGPVSEQTANLDYGKKTYSWQRPRYERQILQETPPQVVLIPSEYTAPSGGWGSGSSNSIMGIRMPALYVVQSAYSWKSNRRITQADPLPNGQYDFIANLPTGSLEALQAEITKKWGLVANREVIQTNALLLKLDHTNAPGLHVVSGRTPPRDTPADMQTVRARIEDFFVPYLENILRQPVVDQTGLNGTVEIQWPLNRALGGANAFEETRKMLLDQLGLDLVKTNTSVEILVVKKAKEANP
jgi:uncharacterized protein (TIGR03435 family)